ncbi:MAG: ABC transporter substrate-binding protein [Gaiellales bacterium]
MRHVRARFRDRLLLLPLLLVVGALALAACGGGTEATPATTEEAPAATTEEAPAATEEAAATTDATETTEAPAEPATLTVALDWFPNPDHVALYYAQDNGMYEARNLTVEFKVPSDPTAGLKLVATNKFDLSIFYESEMFNAAQEGLPVIAVGALIPTPLNSMISLADSKVQGPADIKGATIGNAGLPFDEAIIKTMTEDQGLTLDDVKSINVGYDLVPALLSKKVDAVIGAYFNIEGVHIEAETGQAPTVTKLTDLGVPTYDELLVVANPERLQSDPAYADAVKRFLAAMIEGTEAAQADEAGAIASMEANTEYKPEEIQGMVPDTLPLLTSPAGLPTGCLDLPAWETFGQWLLDRQIIESPVDVSTIATNDYLPGC